jgi:hypothetical protein
MADFRTTAAAYVGIDDSADDTDAGRARREEHLTSLRRAGKLDIDEPMAPVRSDALLCDVAETFPDAPFYALYITGCQVRQAADPPRVTMKLREGVRSELATGGAHLDVAEVLGEVVDVLGTAKRCRGAALALRTRGHIHQQACRKCGHRNADFRDDVAFDELARSAPAAALVHAARSDGGSVADVFRDAHAHAAKSCDKCRAPGACEVDVVLEHAAKALVLSLAWYSTDQEGDDVAALLELVWRDARLPAKRVFSSIGKVKFEVDLFAVAVFQNAHYTAFVRARDGSDSWTYHDRRSAVAVGSFANVVQRCRDGPMLPYLLFYDSLTAAPEALGNDC